MSPYKYMPGTDEAAVAAQNNVALDNEPKFNFDNIRTYVPDQKEREGLIQIAPMSSYSRAGVTFGPVKRNVNGTKFVNVTLPNGKSTATFFSKALGVNEKIDTGMKASELNTLCVLSQNKGVDADGVEIEYFRFERKSVVVDEADNALLASLGL